MPMTSVVDDGLNFVFFLVFNQVRGWVREVGSVNGGLSVRQEKGGVKYVMDAP